MDNTGLLKEPVLEEARKIVFDARLEGEIAQLLPKMLKIDQAHVVMLSTTTLIPRTTARALLGGLLTLAREAAQLFVGAAAPRGLFLLYESWLAEKIGADNAGDLQLARSRNDVAATVASLRVREALLETAGALDRLRSGLVASARRYGDCPCPVFTHHLPAMPATWSSYAHAAAAALARDADALLKVLEDISRVCPLGAGAGAGTSLPIDTTLTAELLGFERGVEFALDAVASRDHALRAAAACAVTTATISRVAQDFLLLIADRAALHLPDNLVGSSSAMPQKRNPFLLEHVAALASEANAYFAAAIGATVSTPFSNAIAVGTYAPDSVVACLDATRKAATLMALMAEGAVPDRNRLADIARSGEVGATQRAWRLRHDEGMSFREAHAKVGRDIRAGAHTDVDDALALARELQYGGGPGAVSDADTSRRLEDQIDRDARRRGASLARWQAGDARLRTCVGAIVGLEEAHDFR